MVVLEKETKISIKFT